MSLCGIQLLRTIILPLKSHQVDEIETKLEDLRRQKRDLFRQVKEMKNEEERRKMQDWEDRMRTEYLLATQQYQRSLSQPQPSECSGGDLDPRTALAKAAAKELLPTAVPSTEAAQGSSSSAVTDSPRVPPPSSSTSAQVWSDQSAADPRLQTASCSADDRSKLTLQIGRAAGGGEQAVRSSPGGPEGPYLGSPPLAQVLAHAGGGARDNPPPLMSPVAIRPPPEMQSLLSLSPPGAPPGMMLDIARPPLLGFHPPRLGGGLLSPDSVPPPLIPPPLGAGNQFGGSGMNPGLSRPPFIVGDPYWGPNPPLHPAPYAQRHTSTGSSGSSPIDSPRLASFPPYPKLQ